MPGLCGILSPTLQKGCRAWLTWGRLPSVFLVRWAPWNTGEFGGSGMRTRNVKLVVGSEAGLSRRKVRGGTRILYQLCGGSQVVLRRVLLGTSTPDIRAMLSCSHQHLGPMPLAPDQSRWEAKESCLKKASASCICKQGSKQSQTCCAHTFKTHKAHQSPRRTAAACLSAIVVKHRLVKFFLGDIAKDHHTNSRQLWVGMFSKIPFGAASTIR